MTRPNIRIWAILALLFLATGSGAGPPRGDVFLPYPSAFSAVAASAANAEPRAAPVAQSGKTGKLPKAVAPANEEEEDEADADGESEAENDSTEPAGPSAAKGLSKDPKVAPAKDAEQSATGPAAAAPPASVPPAEGGANKDHDHPENPLDRIQPESAPDFSAVDFSKLVELRESLHAQVDAEKQRLDGDTAMTPEERLHRMEQLDMKVKEIEVLEGMVRRALEVYQNVLRTSKERNTTASDIKAESEKIIYDLQLTALKAKADMKAMAKDEIHREKEKEKAKDSELAAAAAAAAGGSGVGSDKAGSAGAIGTEKDKSSGGKNAGMSKEPDDMPGQHDSAPDKDGDVGDGKGAKSTGAAPSNGTQPATNGTDSAGKVAQNIAQDIAKDILKEVSGTADKIEDNLLESNAFAEGAKAKGATIETVLKVEDTEKEKFDEEREEASIPLFRPFAKGRGGIVSILIDAESNQYVLSRPNDVTYFYEDGGGVLALPSAAQTDMSPANSEAFERCRHHLYRFLLSLVSVPLSPDSFVFRPSLCGRGFGSQCLEPHQGGSFARFRSPHKLNQRDFCAKRTSFKSTLSHSLASPLSSLSSALNSISANCARFGGSLSLAL